MKTTRVVVRDLFASSRESVLIAGYAVYQGREIFRALAERMEEIPELKVTIFLDVHRFAKRISDAIREMAGHSLA